MCSAGVEKIWHEKEYGVPITQRKTVSKARNILRTMKATEGFREVTCVPTRNSTARMA